MSKKPGQHVVPFGVNWAVRGEGNFRRTSVHSTQKDAIEMAIRIARNKQAEVVIHRSNGEIRDKDSYGHDPEKSKDKKY